MVCPCRSGQVRPADEQPELEIGVRPDRRGRRVQDPPVLAAGREDRRSSSRVPLLHHRAGLRRRAWSGVRRTRAADAGEMPVPGRWASRSASAMVSPADRSRAQCRLRRATAAISRSAAVGTLSPSPMRDRCGSDGRDHRRELGRLERHRVVRPATRPVERQVLLDDRGAQRGRGDRQLRAGRVVRPAGLQPERLPHGLHRRQVRVPRRGRVARRRNGAGPARRVRSRGSCPRPRRPRPSSAIPVETIIGRPRRASRSRKGRFVSSPEPTLKPGTSIASRRSAESSSNGAERNTMPAIVGVRLQRAARRRRAGRVARASRAGPRPGRLARWYAAVGAVADARASGTKVWNLTASAPASAAASTSRWAISASPSWLTPASAMTNTPLPAAPITRPARRNGATSRVPSEGRRDREVGRLVDVDRAIRRRDVAQGHARLRRTGRCGGARPASSRRTRR